MRILFGERERVEMGGLNCSPNSWGLVEDFHSACYSPSSSCFGSQLTRNFVVVPDISLCTNLLYCFTCLKDIKRKTRQNNNNNNNNNNKGKVEHNRSHLSTFFFFF